MTTPAPNATAPRRAGRPLLVIRRHRQDHAAEVGAILGLLRLPSTPQPAPDAAMTNRPTTATPPPDERRD